MILQSLIKNKAITENEKVIYDLLNDSNKYSSSELVKNSGFGKNKVIRIIVSLIEKGLAIKEGNARSTLYSRK